MSAVPTRAKQLPRVSELAWHGPIGKAVLAIAPTTEADPVAILAQALGLFGALVGDSPHIQVGGVRHPCRIWPLVIGETGKGRKGTALNDAERFMRELSRYAEQYIDTRVIEGLSSGEGLLASLGAAPAPAGKDDEQADNQPAGGDGKLTVVETEFAKVLTAAKRDGSTLGPVLRQLWEKDKAGIMTRQNPLQVTGAHLTVLAHITPGELRIRLAESDLVGGTLNRFLLVSAERPHLRSREMLRPNLSELAHTVGQAAEQARLVRLVRRDRRADDLWDHVYAALADDESEGRLGAVLARGPAYTMRLALAFALADGSGMICPDHLMAGLAVWQYAADSARLYFDGGPRRSDFERLAEYVASAQGGRTRSEIYQFFGRNKTGGELAAMVGQLIDRGDVAEDVDRSTGGRPLTRYLWTGSPHHAVAELLERYRFGGLSPD